MNIIKEIKTYTGIGYSRYMGRKELFKVNIGGYRRIYGDFEYFLLIDSNGEVIEKAYTYLNEKLRQASLKQRERGFSALKLLYSYIELFYIRNLSEINNEELNRLIAFLKGGKRESNAIIFEGITIRSNQTINHYFGVYRKYFDFIGIESNIFNESENIGGDKGGNGFFAHTKKNKEKRFLASRMTYEREEVPQYISYDTYNAIINIVKKKYSLREELILKLMYEYGLRIGEVFGLTLEDVINSENSKSGCNELEIRNRFSDKPWQHAKGCMTIYSRDCYTEPEYFKKGYKNAGYQAIQVTDKTMNLIEEYINDTILNPFISQKLQQNLHNKNFADKVKYSTDQEFNCYLFVSKNYTPLTNTSWNRILKNIFKDLDIPIDIGVKKDGLNHKFRHGFAMFKVLIEDYDELRLQRALRHSNPNSCRAYFKPTAEDSRKFQILKDKLLKNGGIYFE